jgi:transcriptional regulator with XRE-family HTH domain
VITDSLALDGLGDRLRCARIAADLSLADLAAATGLSSSFLSLVEKGKSDISLGRLARLVDGLGITLTQLMQPADTHSEESDASHRKVLRKDDRRHLPSDGHVRTQVLLGADNGKMSRCIMTFEPGGTIDVSDYQWRIRGENFYLMLKGALELEFNDHERKRLRVGDCIRLRHEDFRRSWNDTRYDTIVYVESWL